MMVLSIIIPVYNVENYIIRCVESITEYADERIQIIIIDDGSRDDSIDKILPICEANAYIEIYHKINGGLSSARNFGLDKAKGKYIHFVDSDDFIIGENLPQIIDKLENSIEPFFVFRHMTISEYNIANGNNNNKGKYVKVSRVDYIKHSRNPITNVWKTIVSKKLITEHELIFREGVLCEDIEWITKILLYVDHIVWSDLLLYIYNNERTDSIMKVLSAKRVDDTAKNIQVTKSIVDNISSDEERKLFKKLLFIEWCMNLVFYSMLEKSQKTHVHFNDCFVGEKEVTIIKIYVALRKILSLSAISYGLNILKRLRKIFVRFIYTARIAKYNEALKEK